MAVAYRSVTDATGTASATATLPTGTVAGDMMLLSVYAESSTATIGTPTGWTLVPGSSQSSSGNFASAVFYKVAGASEGSVSVSPTGAIFVEVCRTSYSTAASASLDGQSNASGGTATATSLPAPSITTTHNGDLLVWIGFNFSATTTPPTGFTTRYNAGDVAIGDKTQTTAGATGTQTGTDSVADVWTVTMLALTDAASGGTVSSGTVNMGGSGGTHDSAYTWSQDAMGGAGGIVHHVMGGAGGMSASAITLVIAPPTTFGSSPASINILTENQSDLENGITGWSGAADANLLSNSSVTAADTTTSWQGTGSLKVTTDGLASAEGSVILPGIPCAAGQSVTFSVYVKGSAAVSFALRVKDYTNNGATNGVTQTFSTTGFTRITYTNVQGATATTDLRLAIRCGSAVTFWIDGAQAEYASSASAWVPGGSGPSGGLVATGGLVSTVSATLGGSGGLSDSGTTLISGAAVLSGAGGLVDSAISLVIAPVTTLGDNGSGLVATPNIPVSSGPVDMGGAGGLPPVATQQLMLAQAYMGGSAGLTDFATEILLSGIVRMGQSPLQAGGMESIYGTIGYPGGHWVFVTVWIWRQDSPNVYSWHLCPVKVWRGAGVGWNTV